MIYNIYNPPCALIPTPSCSSMHSKCPCPCPFTEIPSTNAKISTLDPKIV